MQNLCFMTGVTQHVLTSYSENGAQLILGVAITVTTSEFSYAAESLMAKKRMRYSFVKSITLRVKPAAAMAAANT